jgi:hypothetical protein
MSNTDEVEILVVGYDDVFLADAGNNLDRCGAARDADPTAHAGAAASTIFLSVASIEAFVSERLVFHELKENISRDQADRIRKLGKGHQQLNALVKCSHKEGLDRHHTYEPTQALFALRGCLIHRSASFLRTDGWPDRIEEKHRRHIEHITGHGLDWTSRVLNHVTAEWAFRTASEVLVEAGDHVPAPPRGERLKVQVHLADGLSIEDMVTSKDTIMLSDPPGGGP